MNRIEREFSCLPTPSMADTAANDMFPHVNGFVTVGFFTAALASSCVINRPARPSMPESAQGPSAPPVTGSPVVPQTAPADEDDAPPATSKPGSIWVRGYWHWDGVRYVWQRGRWESSAAPAPTP